MRRKLGLGLLVAGALVALAGCGSSNSTLSYSKFSNAAEQICSAANNQSSALGQASSTASPATAATLTKLVSIAQDAITKLKALSGPSSLNSARDTFVSDGEQAITDVQGAITAAKASDQASYIAAATKLQSSNQQSNADGSKLGAVACAKST